MAVPKERKQQKHLTIAWGPTIAGRIDPLDDTVFLYEQIIRELVNEGHEEEDDGTVVLGSTWPS